MRYKNVFFDLDGTITEPAEGITNAIIYALDKYDIKVEDRASLYKFIGPPLRDSFKEFYGFSDEQAEEAVKFYREYYSDRGLIENEIMPGMKDALIKLKEAGCHLYVATSKPEIYAKKILENLDIDGYFDIIAGATFDKTRDKKELVIEYLLDISGIKALGKMSETVMVGDRYFDIQGAKAFGLDNIGVTFGYGTREEFIECGAMKIVDTAEEMVEFI